MAFHLWSISEASGSKPISAQSETTGYLAGLLTWVLAAGVFVAVKGASDEMPPWTFCFWRVVLAGLLLVPFVRAHREAIIQFVRAHGLEAFIIGALGLGITQGLMFTALNYTSAVTAGIIFSTTPILTLVVAAVVLREALGPWQIVGSVCAFFGIVFITVHGSLFTLLKLDIGLGDLLVVVAACTFSAYTVLLKRAKFKLERLPLLVVLMASGAVAAFPFFLYEVFAGLHDNLNVKGYAALGYAVIFGGALMYLCYNWSIDVLGASRAGTMQYSQIVFTAVLAWLILGETIAWYHFVGTAFILVGIVMVNLLRPKASS